MQNVLKKFERVIGSILIMAIMSYIALPTIEMVWETAKGYANRFGLLKRVTKKHGSYGEPLSTFRCERPAKI